MIKAASFIFIQCLQRVPRNVFARLVKKHDAEYALKGPTCWTQFAAILLCQIAHPNSLRVICNGMACC